jgi:hypothetical protein
VTLSHEGREQAGRCLDLTHDSMTVRLERALPAGALLSLKLQAPDGKPVAVFARVVTCKETPGDPERRFLAGLRFVALTADEESLLDRLKPGAAPAPPAPEPAPAAAAQAPKDAKKPVRGWTRARVAIAAGVAVAAAAVGLWLGPAGAPPLPGGVEEVALLDGALLLKVQDPALARSHLFLEAVSMSLRPRHIATALLVDAQQRPLAALDVAAGDALRCQQPAPAAPAPRVAAATGAADGGAGIAASTADAGPSEPADAGTP